MKNKTAITLLTLASALTSHFVQAADVPVLSQDLVITKMGTIRIWKNEWSSNVLYIDPKTKTIDLYERRYIHPVGEDEQLIKEKLNASPVFARHRVHCDTGIYIARPSLSGEQPIREEIYSGDTDSRSSIDVRVLCDAVGMPVPN